MKKHGILNSQLSRIIASMGHTDLLVIGDSGLPVPNGIEVVDLALTRNVPGFIQTLQVVLEELEVEEAIIAEETVEKNGALYKGITDLLKNKTIKQVTHEELKEIGSNGGNVAYVRTGEASPYANIILRSGVTFG